MKITRIVLAIIFVGSLSGAYGIFMAHAASIRAPLTAPSETSVTITWETDIPTDSCVKLGSSSLAPYAVSGCGSGAPLVTSHSVAILNLGSGTSYLYTVGYENPAPGSYFSQSLSFLTTRSAITPTQITISGATASVTGTGAIITWTTSVGTDSCIKLGRMASALNSVGCTSESAAGISTSHSRMLTGLSLATYYFSVGYSVPELVYDTSVNTFTVVPAVTGPPASPMLQRTSAATASPVNLSWNTLPDATEYKLYRRTPPDSFSWDDSPITPANFIGTAYSDASVTPGTRYQYYVSACNAFGCSIAQNYIIALTPGTAPTPTPILPLALSVTQPVKGVCFADSSSLSVAWAASGDKSKVDHYTLTYWESSSPIQTIGTYEASTTTFTANWSTLSNSNSDYAQIQAEAKNSYELTLASALSPFFSVKPACPSPTPTPLPFSSPTPSPASAPSPTPAPSPASAPSEIPAPNPQIPAYQKYPNSTLIRAIGDTKVWIITNGFKRYVVGPQILGFYGHLKNAPIIDVPADELAKYKLAAWVRYVNDPKVYEVNDDATKHWLNMSAEDFYNTGRRWEAVFIVNKLEIDFYKTSAPVTIIK